MFCIAGSALSCFANVCLHFGDFECLLHDKVAHVQMCESQMQITDRSANDVGWLYSVPPPKRKFWNRPNSVRCDRAFPADVQLMVLATQQYAILDYRS